MSCQYKNLVPPPPLGNLRKFLINNNSDSFAVIKGCEAITFFVCIHKGVC